MPRIILYGDIHGCLDELKKLRASINPQKNDIEISVGDFLNKGPDSIKTLRYLKKKNILAVMGNNEAKIIRLYALYLKKGEKCFEEMNSSDKKTLLEIGKEDIAYLKSLPYFLKIDQLTVVHGGIAQGMRLSEDMSEKEKKRITQLRFYNKKNEPIAYNDYENRAYFWSEVYDGREGFVIFGHHPFAEPKIEKYAIGIDTGCVYGGALTAITFAYKNQKVDTKNFVLHTIKAKQNYFE